MDDTQDKIRRNLVVFSAAIVIGWFLDIKLAALTKFFVPGSDFDSVSADRLWIVVLLVLFYLSLRYRFDSTTISQMATLSGELDTQRHNYLSKYLTRKLSQISRTETSLPIFDASLMEKVSDQVKRYEVEHSHKIKFRLSICNPWGESSPIEPDMHSSLWNGTVAISEEYSEANSSRNLVVKTGHRFDFAIPISGRIWVITHAIIHAISYSKSAIEFIVPLVLSGAAFIIVIIKLFPILS